MRHAEPAVGEPPAPHFTVFGLSCGSCPRVGSVLGCVGSGRWVTAGPAAFWVSVCEHLEQEQLKTSYLLALKL